MWDRPPKKTIFTLRVDNYAPEICEITYPLLKHYAKKIGADFYTIKDRKFPDWPPVYEKLQIYELAKEMENDWNIYIDSDTLVHPDFFDVTEHLTKDTVCHNGRDMAGNRWTYDRFFRRDGRNIGSCNWFTVASDWCIELWRPIDDLTRDQIIERIHPVVDELKSIITAEHLIDDYTLSRNISKYGLKFTTIRDIEKRLFDGAPGFLWHQYTIPIEQKVIEMHKILKGWKVE